MKNEQRQNWLPLWIDSWLFGSTRLELKPEERAIWVDLLALGAKDNGYIRAGINIPYPTRQMAGLLMVEEELLQRTIDICIKTEKLEKRDTGILRIINWDRYQVSDRYRRKLTEGTRKPQYRNFIHCPEQFRLMATKKGLVKKSRLLVAIALNRNLTKEEEVRHINGNEEDHRIENLMLFSSHQSAVGYKKDQKIVPFFDGRKLGQAEKENIENRLAGFSAEKTAQCAPKTANYNIRREEKRVEEKRVDNIFSQIDNLLKQFHPQIQTLIKTYWDRAKQKNKSKVITDGRKLTLITELWNSRELCHDEELFKYALESAISRDAINIGYINAIVKDKKCKIKT